MNVTDRPNRTWLCSVIFMDIVSYTKHPLDEQMALKYRFSEIVTRVARQHLNAPDLFTVDAGDGAALCYLGDPEDMLFCATDLLHAFQGVGAQYGIELPVRIGINLGPVKVHTNVAGQPNPIGDGINVAQRIMSFANAGEILVSRSFYEVVGCLADEYARMFEFVGTREDKHVRKHDLYQVRDPERTVMRPLPQPVAGDEDLAERTTLRTAAEWISTDVGAGIEAETALAAIAAPDLTAPSAPQALPARERALPAGIDPLQLEEKAAPYLGPIAPMLTRRALESADSLAAAIARLARRIPGQGDREAFLRDVAELACDGALPDLEDPSLATRLWVRPSPSQASRRHFDTSAWEATELEAATRHLSEYVGPMAGVVVRRVAARSRDLPSLYRGLAEHIPNPAERANFLQEAGIDAR